MSEISPLVKRSLVDQALEQLRLRINQGAWTVGQRLPTEPELSAELGISLRKLYYRLGQYQREGSK